MVERIQKTGREEYWKVSASGEAKKDKRHQGKQEEERDTKQNKDRFGDSSDFIQKLAKDPKKFRSERIASSQIKGFTFRGISTDREKAVLEVDIALVNGGLLKGAQLALSRQEGMRYLGRQLGDEILASQLTKGTMLTIALPKKAPEEKRAETVPMVSMEPQAGVGSSFSWYYYVILTVLLTAVVLLIYLFFMA